jgi:hypothetical protein
LEKKVIEMARTLPKDIMVVVYQHLEMLPFDISEDSLRHDYLDYIKEMIKTKGSQWVLEKTRPVDEHRIMAQEN